MFWSVSSTGHIECCPEKQTKRRWFDFAQTSHLEHPDIFGFGVDSGLCYLADEKSVYVWR
jgi:hypothetical protein